MRLQNSLGFRWTIIIIVIAMGWPFFMSFAYPNDLCDNMKQDKTHNIYRLPVDGRWLVYWGGCSERDNTLHNKVAAQRYAYDLVKIDNDGKYFKGEGKTLADYYSYGESVLAPANGIVVTAVDGVDDSLTPNLYFIPGNLVIIKHGGGEYSYIAHLQKGSIQVKEGDRVKGGQPIAKCGSSGNSTMPHVHYHVSDNPIFQDGKGLAVTFQNIQVNGKMEKRSKPVKGDMILSE